MISESFIAVIGTVPAYKALSLGGIQALKILHSVLPPKFPISSLVEKSVSTLTRSPARAKIFELLFIFLTITSNASLHDETFNLPSSFLIYGASNLCLFKPSQINLDLSDNHSSFIDQ